MNNIKKQILNINKSDSFLRKLYEIYLQEIGSRKVFYQTVVSLHNDGEINFTKEILKTSSQDHNFFNAKNMFEEILPDLDIPIQDSMSCVKHIFQMSGNDMSAGMVFSSFAKYCEKDENRVKEAIQIINSDISYHAFIPSVIKAGSKFNLDEYLEIAIEFTKHSDTNICKEATYSLGGLQYKDHLASLNKSFKVIKSIIETMDDSGVLSISIEVIFTLFTFNSMLEDETVRLIEIALKDSDDNILHSASKLCFHEKKKLPIKLFSILLHALENVNYQHQGTMDNIDYGLQHLLEKNQDMVVVYLEKTLIKNKKISITSFDSVLRDLYQKHNELLNKYITKWLVDGDINLCTAVVDIVGFFHASKMILSADTGQLKTQDNATHLFVIRKAIGWLFYHQISAVSFVISMIEILNKDNIQQVEELLFDPFLISYSGSVKDYLKSIKKPKTKTKKVISNLLQRLEEHHNDLENAWSIKELQPSQEQQESYSRLQNRLISKAMNESRKDSLMSLIAEFTVLYGRRSIVYYPALSNNQKDIRQEMDSQKFEHSIEYPSIDYIDPHDLDYMLRVFRYKRFIK